MARSTLRNDTPGAAATTVGAKFRIEVTPAATSRSATSCAAVAGVAIGIIATPAPAAQEVADRLVEAGVTSILNFAPTVVAAPAGVSLRKVDLAIELQILSFYQQRRQAAGSRDGNGARVRAR